MSKWYIGGGEKSEVVVSTRIRLARNLEDYPFPAKLSAAGKKQVNELVRDALLGGCDEDLSYIEMESLTRAQAISLAERHLISPEFASSVGGRALLLSDDESVSIMLCEEDHIRLQVMKAGLALEEAFDIADKLDSLLECDLLVIDDLGTEFVNQFTVSCLYNLFNTSRL